MMKNPLFLAFLSDVFGSKLSQKPAEAIKNALIPSTISHNLDPFQKWVTKAIQLQEICEIRHCIMILGSGRTYPRILLHKMQAHIHMHESKGYHSITDVRYSRSIFKRLERWYFLSIVAYCKQHTTHGSVSMVTLMQFRLKTLTQWLLFF